MIKVINIEGDGCHYSAIYYLPQIDNCHRGIESLTTPSRPLVKGMLHTLFILLCCFCRQPITFILICGVYIIYINTMLARTQSTLCIIGNIFIYNPNIHQQGLGLKLHSRNHTPHIYNIYITSQYIPWVKTKILHLSPPTHTSPNITIIFSIS